MTEHSDPDQAYEHPFIRALQTWEAWSTADTWTRVVAHARDEGRDLSELGNLGELTRGPDPLTALRANRAVVELMTGWQWQVMRAARTQGYGWGEIGQALGLDAEQARQVYLAAVDRQALAAHAMPELGPCCAMTPAGGTWPTQATPTVRADTVASPASRGPGAHASWRRCRPAVGATNPPLLPAASPALTLMRSVPMTPTPPRRAATLQATRRLAWVRLGLVLAVAFFAAAVAGLSYLVSFEAISAFVVRVSLPLKDGERWSFVPSAVKPRTTNTPKAPVAQSALGV